MRKSELSVNTFGYIAGVDKYERGKEMIAIIIN